MCECDCGRGLSGAAAAADAEAVNMAGDTVVTPDADVAEADVVRRLRDAEPLPWWRERDAACGEDGVGVGVGGRDAAKAGDGVDDVADAVRGDVLLTMTGVDVGVEPNVVDGTRPGDEGAPLLREDDTPADLDTLSK